MNVHVWRALLQRLGRCIRFHASLDRLGGSSLLPVAGTTSTFDINVQFSTAHEHHAEFIRCLRTVSREMGILVELASPEQFIPLPAGFQERCQFVGRYGSLDVFHFDFYSIALAKVHRGNEKDFDDVVRMVKTELISLSTLEAYLAQILPDYEFYQPTADPEMFRRKFALLKDKLGAAGV